MNIPSEYLEWRFWVGVVAPGAICWGAMNVLEPTLLNASLIFSFVLLVVPSFTRTMARSQARAELRAELERLQAEFFNVVDMVNRMPYEESRPYIEGLHLMEFRIRVLESVLESKK